ncbi:hypothetical protein D3C81_1731000 [compost metagenome]
MHEKDGMIRQPLQRRIGQDQIRRPIRRPGRDVADRPVNLGGLDASLIQHVGAGIHAMDLGRRMAALQQGRVLACAAAQVPDFSRREIFGQAHQQVERGAIPLGFKAIILSGVPLGGSVAHIVTTPRR